MADRAMNEGRLQNIRDAVADGTANIDDARELLAEVTELRLLWEALNAERRTEAPMADRLTPEREAEIRQPRTRTLDWAPQVYEEWDDERADLIAELDAVRAEREAARVERLRAVRESEAHSLVRTELHRQLGHHMAQGAMVESLTERALAAEARVRELEAVLAAAQARLLREMAMQWSDEDDGEPRGTKDVVQWLHARADELEGKR